MGSKFLDDFPAIPVMGSAFVTHKEKEVSFFLVLIGLKVGKPCTVIRDPLPVTLMVAGPPGEMPASPDCGLLASTAGPSTTRFKLRDLSN